MDTITQPRMSPVGASPAKKQKTRSYAAVVRSSFKPEQSEVAQPPVVGPMTSQDQRVSSNGTKSKSQTLDPRRSQLDENENNMEEAVLMPLPSELDVQSFLRKLDQALELEVKFRGAMQPSSAGQNAGGGLVGGGGKVDQVSAAGAITSGMRDGSAHVLRCLKVWYDLPSDVLFNAISSIDRFLAKMKAQPKHLSCIAVSAFHLACHQHRQLQLEAEVPAELLVGIPDPADLVSISQSRCSPSDLLRMQNILQSKLEIGNLANPLQSTADSAPVTSLTFLKLMYQVVRATALRLDLFDLLPSGHGNVSLPDHLVHQLEILACDSMTLNYRPCEVALALLATDIQARVDKDPKHTPALRFLSELQKYCNISSDVFVDCLNVVMSQLDKYNSECMVAHRQRLVWKLSNRTLRHLRPTDKLRATLPTISEAAHNATSKRARSTSECSLQSEEDSMSLSSEEDDDLNRSTASSESSSDAPNAGCYYADKLCVIEEPMDVEVEAGGGVAVSVAAVAATGQDVIERSQWDTEE